MVDPLSTVLFAGLAGHEGGADEMASSPALEERLSELATTGANAWPQLKLSAAEFVAYLAERVAGVENPAEAIERIRAADLFIACACARGDEVALRAFETEYFGEIDAAMARVRNAPIDRSELCQLMRNRIFVAEPGQQPRIAGYLGKGDLHGWLRISATRVLLDLVRKPVREVSFDDSNIGEHASLSDDPEAAFLKQEYRAEFKLAFTHAMAALTARQRNLLRHRYLHGLGVEEVARIYGIHRVTASRAMSRAQEALQAGIRRYFMTHLDVGRTELASIMGLIASQLHLSLSRLLKTKQPDSSHELEE